MNIKLNPNLNIPALKQQFVQGGVLQIQNAFPEDVANAIRNELEKANWHLQVQDYDGNGKVVPVGTKNIHPFPLGLIDWKDSSVNLEKLFYTRYATAYDGKPPDIISEFYTYLDSEEYLETMRQITGKSLIAKSLMESVCYTKNCFLGCHEDGPDPHLLVASVYNLARPWGMDWGGLLMIEKKGGFSVIPPNWNSISLMNIPVLHWVTSVSPAAIAKRYSISGWLADTEGKPRYPV